MSDSDISVPVMAVAVNSRYDRGVSRWEPNARGRLEQAAMELYAERGFDSTTVADIAERSGLTERTFFRYFADKREVLFGGARALQEFLVGKVDEGARSGPPMEAIVSALADAADVFFEDRRQFARRRQAVIAANMELQERELIKLATLSTALDDALRRRGVPDLTANLAAEASIAVFKIAFERWVQDKTEGTLSSIIRESANEMKAVTSGRKPSVRR
jgi:AcrR family transcriptional regulator